MNNTAKWILSAFLVFGCTAHMVSAEENGSQEPEQSNIEQEEVPEMPKIIGAYNSASGIELKWKAVEGADSYVVYEKMNGRWTEEITLPVGHDSLKISGDVCSYILPANTGSGVGYILTVEAVRNGIHSAHDDLGAAIYRLAPPMITSIEYRYEDTLKLNWKKIESSAKGFQIQYAPASDTSKWTSVDVGALNTAEISGLKSGEKYVFRMRSFKVNKDRGTFYSYYSPWMSAVMSEQQAVTKPKLTGIYNGSKGIGVQWIAQDYATDYEIYRKENGIWKKIRTVSVNDNSLQRSGSRLMYTDTSVKDQYGKGYIYSVAARRNNAVSDYDKAGLAIYRLRAPSITGTETKWATLLGGKLISGVNVRWSAVECQVYQLEVALENNAKAGKWRTVEINAPEVQKYFGVSELASMCGLSIYDTNSLTFTKDGQKVIFRIRCGKTNKDRGTTWSEYSEWKSVKF